MIAVVLATWFSSLYSSYQRVSSSIKYIYVRDGDEETTDLH